APGHLLPNGDLLKVRVVPAARYGHAHLTANVRAPAPGADGTRPPRMTQHDWLTGRLPIVYAHEIGHQLGLRDELWDRSQPAAPARVHTLKSVSGGADTRITIARTADNQGSLLRVFTAPPPDGRVPGGLRPRHLDQLHSFIGDIPGHPPAVNSASDGEA